MGTRFITWILAALGRECFHIGRQKADVPGEFDAYLTRWTLLGRRHAGGGKVFLHHFHRGDAEPYNHDHPWPFWSLILWGGYWEWTPLREGDPVADIETLTEKAVWYGLGRLLRRPAEWQHRVELPRGRKAWTLVWTGPKSRSWGFICPGRGWIPWREHEANQLAGKAGCGD